MGTPRLLSSRAIVTEGHVRSVSAGYLVDFPSYFIRWKFPAIEDIDETPQHRANTAISSLRGIVCAAGVFGERWIAAEHRSPSPDRRAHVQRHRESGRRFSREARAAS